MKKLTFFLFITLLIVGTISAQPVREQQREVEPPRNERRRELPQQPGNERRREVIPQIENELRRNPPQAINNRQLERNLITVDGILKLENGHVSIQGTNSNTVYHIPMLNRYIGFISGLREGASASVEGFQFRNTIHPIKATIDGQTYDFQRLAANNMNFNNNPRMNNHRQSRENFGPNRKNTPNHRNRHNGYPHR